MSTNIYKRTGAIKDKINIFLREITRSETDYFDTFNQDDWVKFKYAISDVNNAITLKLTLSSAKWASRFFQLSNHEEKQLIDKIDKTKPNSNGYDIVIEKQKVLIEIKSTVPINNGEQYGAAQWGSILKDAVKLERGIKSLADTKDYYKIIAIWDLGEKTNEATIKLTQVVKNISTKDEKRKELINIINKLKIMDIAHNLENIQKDRIYLKKIEI